MQKLCLNILRLIPLTVALLGVHAAEVRVVFPPAGSTLNAGDQTFVAGCVKPASAALTINGIPVTPYRTGSFVVMLPIRDGKNTLEIRSGRFSARHEFFLKKPAPKPPPPPSVKPVFPSAPAGVATGKTFLVRCEAPLGFTPQVQVGERLIAMRPDPRDATQWSAPLRFYCPVERLPVTFSAKGLPDAPAGPLCALTAPQIFKVTGELFATRVRSAPDSGETLLFPVQGDIIASDGFVGAYRTLTLAGKIGYLESRHLQPITLPPGIVPNAQPADITRGFGPHPPPGRGRGDILIAVDAGHGGSDSGAVGPSGLQEKTVTLLQARIIEQALKRAGYRTLLTRSRDQDVGLYDRVRAGYRAQANAFISVHYNSCPSPFDPRDRRHISTYAWNGIGRQLALPVHAELAKISPARNAGVLSGNLAVCRNPAVPSILLELDFITSPEGEELIQCHTFQTKVAQAVLAGVDAWCGR